VPPYDECVEVTILSSMVLQLYWTANGAEMETREKNALNN